MNNDRFIQDCDKPAIQELNKISMLLESDPDVIESMSWDELQTETLIEGLDINKPLLLFTRPLLEACVPDSSSPFRLSAVALTGFVSTLGSWRLGEVPFIETDRILNIREEAHFDACLGVDNFDTNFKRETISHVWGLNRIEFSRDSIGDSLKDIRLGAKALEGSYGPEDLYQDCALKWWKHTKESDIAKEVLSKENERAEKVEGAFDCSNSLMLHPWIQQMVKGTCRATALRFRLEQEDLEGFLTDKLHTELQNVWYPKHKSFSEALEAWSHTVILNYCKNRFRHLAVMKYHEEAIDQTHTRSKRNSVSIPKAVVPTPEDELIEKEEKQMWASRALEIHGKVHRVIAKDVIIVSLWVQGQTLKQIACAVDKPINTVGRKLSQIQKAVLKAIAIEETEENRVLFREGLRELLAKSLQSPL